MTGTTGARTAAIPRLGTRCQHGVILLAITVLLSSSAPVGARVERTSQSPAVVDEPGGFRALKLAMPPAIDGREWVHVSAVNGEGSTRVPSPDGSFLVVFRAVGGDTGDFERYRLFFRRGREVPVLIEDATGWVYITPDSRYVFTEPLNVLDVRHWKRYRLSGALGVQNYTAIEAVSRDGRRLLVSRTDCALDCREERRDYYEIALPQ